MFLKKKKEKNLIKANEPLLENEVVKKIEKKPFIIEKKHYIMFGIFFSVFCLFLCLGCFGGDDYWWHVKVGEWIVQNKQIPKTGIFSWYAQENNLSWFAHEWLAEVILYGFTCLFGPNGGVVYLILCIILVSALLYCFNYKGYMKNMAFSCILQMGLFFALAFICTARPHMLTISFFTILVYNCRKIKEDENYNKYLFFPLLTIFWANYHGGSTNLTYIVPLIFFFTSLFNFKYGKVESIRIKKGYRYLILAIMNIFAIMVNPRTYELLYYPYSYTSEYSKYINEWKSPNMSGAPFIFILIIVICLIFFTTTKNINFSELVIIGAFMLLTLKSVRFEIWLFIVTTMFIFKYIRELNDKSVYKFLSYEFVIIGIGLFFYSIYSFATGTSYISKGVSDEAMEVIKNTEYEHLMNYYDYGSYLIYEDVEVFIDGRADMYVDTNFFDEAKSTIYTYDYLPSDFLEDYDCDLFLLPSKCIFSWYLECHPEEYELIYKGDEETDFCKIFKKIDKNSNNNTMTTTSRN